MARTLAEITAALHAEFPNPPGIPVRVAGENGFLTGVAYDARIAEMAEAERVAQLEAEATAAARDERLAVARALRVLTADITRLEDTTQGMTVAQMRAHLARTDRILRGLIRGLIGLRLWEDDDGRKGLTDRPR